MININNINYRIKNLIHQSHTSKLYKCTYMNQNYAIKCYKHNYKSRWENEIDILDEIGYNHYIIKLIDYCQEIYLDNEIYYPLVFEYCEYGDMIDFLNNNEISSNLVKIILNQITLALKHLGNYGITHRDIKLDNILISNLDPFTIKLIDFEFATEYRFTNKQVGTLSYMSPEVLFNGMYETKKNDIWSLGVLLFIIYTSYRPYDDTIFRDDKLISKNLTNIKNNNWLDFWKEFERKKKLNEDFKDLIQKMLKWKERNRISLDGILNHNFLNESYQKQCKCVIS